MNAHYTLNKILFDWVSISSKIDSVDTILEMLGLCDVTFIDTYGLYGYKERIFFDGISIHYGGRTDTILLEMSGQGCRAFETYGNGDFDALFRYVLENPKELNISRLDVAYDDFNNLIELELLQQDIYNHCYVSVCSEENVGFRYFGGAWTIEAGKRGSNIMLRIYDKAKERNATEEFSHWVRCELQLRHSHALQFVRFLLGNQAYTPDGDVVIDNLRLDRLYFSVLNHFIRFIDNDSNNDSNKWRKPIKDHWARFAYSVTDQRVSLYVKPGVEYNELRLNHSVEEQYAGMIYTYVQVHGVRKLLDSIEPKKHKLNPKYKNVISDHQARLDAYWEEITKDCRKI